MEIKNYQIRENVIVEDFENEFSALMGIVTSIGSCTYHQSVGSDS